MSTDLAQELLTLRIDARQWRFADLRIDIEPMSFGSDAANPHTQYSNAIAIFDDVGDGAVGAAFTLGEGNAALCRAAHYLITELDGLSIVDLVASPKGFYETLVNPRQLRWISPYAGLPMMAAGLVVNTLIDAASKRVGMPAWEYMAKLPADVLLSLMSLRHLDPGMELAAKLARGAEGVAERCDQLRRVRLPVYHTTWIGHSAEDVSAQIREQTARRGIRTFKIKIGSDFDRDLEKLDEIMAGAPSGTRFAVDANQTLTLDEAKTWMRALSIRHVLWLEEPFAPDNTVLFGELSRIKAAEGLSCEIASGENCPNPHTAAALVSGGLDRYQSDPCRMLGLVDGILTAALAHYQSREFTPHAGGTALDELSLHLQLVNLARIDLARNPSTSLTENVGFCSRFYAQPALVRDGEAAVPTEAGLLVGLASEVSKALRDYRDGVSWLKL